MYSVTPKQQIVLDAIKQFMVVHHGTSPTVRELCAATGNKSVGGMAAHLRALEKRGHIKRLPSAARSITLMDRDVRAPEHDKKD